MDAERVDLEDFGELCRLVLVAKRLGCRIHISEVPPPVHDLIVLSGLRSVMLESSYDDERDDS